MKRIRTLQQPTPHLASYQNQVGDGANWRQFRNDQTAFLELRSALVELQHGLCGYCEIDLIESDIQVEHVIPQSDSKQGATLAIWHTNLIACCRGGSAREFDTDGQDDATRYGIPSCGQAKGSINSPNFIDPRNLPDLPSLLRVQPDGIIVPDESACAHSGFTVSQVQETIKILRLNVERLRRVRQNRWNDLKRSWGILGYDAKAMQAAASEELLPDPDNETLNKFFTTARSYFGELGESILAEPPQAWI